MLRQARSVVGMENSLMLWFMNSRYRLVLTEKLSHHPHLYVYSINNTFQTLSRVN